MKFKNKDNYYFLVLEENEIIIDKLKEFCIDNNIKSGVIVSGIGMLKDFEIGYFNGEQYDKRKESTPHELVSLSGNISEFNNEIIIHAHISLASQTNKIIGGHLFNGKVMVTSEIMIIELPFNLNRKKVSETLKLIHLN